MRRRYTHEFLYQIFALLLVIILVHAAYVLWIRPQAEWLLAAQQVAEAAGDPAGRQSLFVIIKDYEQETCLILALWALAIMAYKARDGHLERRLLGRRLLPMEEGSRILPEDTRQLSRPLEALPAPERELLLPRDRKSVV